MPIRYHRTTDVAFSETKELDSDDIVIHKQYTLCDVHVCWREFHSQLRFGLRKEKKTAKDLDNVCVAK